MTYCICDLRLSPSRVIQWPYDAPTPTDSFIGLKIIQLRVPESHTLCPRSSDPFYVVSYNMKWVTTSWTYSIYHLHTLVKIIKNGCKN